MIETARLLLRPWRDEDVAPFAAGTNTPAVMEHLGGPQSRATFDSILARVRASQATHGFCFWIIERLEDRAILGFCGLKVCDVGPVAGDVEIGWRLREDAWGQGYAREAAEASLAWGWQNLPAPRVIAMTVAANHRSWGLMERLGLRRRADLDFGHPAFQPDHPLRAHIVYAIDRPLSRAGR